jgi:hypothetical protein
MKVLAAIVVAMSSLATNLAPGTTYASDGTIYFSGQIVLSTLDPRLQAPRDPKGLVPRHATALQAMPLEARFELLDYFADYMQERGKTRSQLTVKTNAYE